jgi:hypothetical protein
MKKILFNISIIILIGAGCNSTSSTKSGDSPTYVYGQNQLADEATTKPATLEEKQQCAKDGAAWVKKNLEDFATPQAIYQSNLQVGTSDKSFVTSSMSVGNPTYAFSTKLNTCLVDYLTITNMMDGSSLVDHGIEDVYTNKSIDEWLTKSGVKSQDIIGTQAGFRQTENNLIQQQK